MEKTQHVDVAIIGAGHAGLNAMKEVRRHTDNYLLINGGPLGTTCARVGCMPSKALIEISQGLNTARSMSQFSFDPAFEPSPNHEMIMENVRDLRDTFVDLVLANTTDELPQDKLMEGYAQFEDVNTLRVNGQRVTADRFVIATGTRPLIPGAFNDFKEDILTSDDLFELERLPKSVAIIGLGYIGLEIGQALHRLGSKVVGLDRGDTLAGIQDPIIRDQALNIFQREFPIHLGHQPRITKSAKGIRIVVDGEEYFVEKLFLSVGRVPNLEHLGLERLGVQLNGRGIPEFDPATYQLQDLPIFIAGDVTGERGTLQDAADGGRIAGFNAMRKTPLMFKHKTPMSIAFSDPNIACVGKSWSEIDMDQHEIGMARLGPVGRAMIMGKNRGLIRVYAEKNSGKIVGGSMIGVRTEHLAHLLAWGIQQNMTAVEMLRMPFYHPVIEEGLQDALHHLVNNLDKSHDTMVQFESYEPMEEKRGLLYLLNGRKKAMSRPSVST